MWLDEGCLAGLCSEKLWLWADPEGKRGDCRGVLTHVFSLRWIPSCQAPQVVLGQMEEWVDGWYTDSRMYNYMNGWVDDAWIDGMMHAWIHGCMVRRQDEWMDGWMDSWIITGWMDQWMRGFMNVLLNTWLRWSLRLNPYPSSPPQSVPVTRTALSPLCRPNLELWGVCSILIPRAAHIACRPRTANFCSTKRPPTSTGSQVSASLCLCRHSRGPRYGWEGLSEHVVTHWRRLLRFLRKSQSKSS